METSTTEIPWDDDSIQVSTGRIEVDKFRLKDNEVARILLIDENAYLAMTHYSNAVKRYIVCIKDKYDSCPACDDPEVGDAKQRFGANVVQYRTTFDGAVIEPVDFSIKMWTFGNDKFAQIRSIKKEWGDLRQHDLKVACQSEQFQELVITPLPKALWLQDDTFKKRVAEEYKANRYDVAKLIGRQNTPEEVKMIMAGQDIRSAPSTQKTDEQIADVVSDIEKDLENSTDSEESIDFNSLLDV